MATNWFSDAFANPKFKQFLSEAGQDLGYGLTQSPTIGGAFGVATQRGQQLQPQRDLAQQQKAEETKRAEMISKYATTLRGWGGEYEDLASGVEAGGLDPAQAYMTAWDRRYKPQAAPTADWAKLNDGTLFNQRTGDTMPLEGADGGAGGFVDPKEAFNREKDLAAQYGGQDPVKTYQAVRNGYERVRKSAEIANSNPNGSGAADISLVFAYMKMLDPTSVVREGEFASAANAGGVPDQVASMYNRLIQGDKLTPDVRGQFVQQADAIYGDVSSNLEALNQQFTTRANGWGVEPSNFLYMPEQYDPAGGGAPADIQPLLDKYR